MRVELMVTVRGVERRVRWLDGQLMGDAEILRRLDRVVEAGQVDRGDLLSVVRGVELVAAQHVELVNLDLVEPVDADEAAAPISLPLVDASPGGGPSGSRLAPRVA